MQLRMSELMGTSFGIACLQETGTTVRQQKFLQRQLEQQDYTVVWGTPTPQAWNRVKKLRSQTGVIPGVAMIAQKRLDLRYRTPNTLQGKHLEKRGRLILGAYPTPVTQVLVMNAYLPSGGTQAAVQDRLSCLDEIYTEVSSYGNAPIVLTGDWNLDPGENPLVPLLLQRGWHLPVLSGPNPSQAPYTYQGAATTTVIDYCMSSPSLALVSQCVQPSLSQHQHVWTELPSPKDYVAVPEVPRAVEYGPIMRKHDHDWTPATQQLLQCCDSNDSNTAWDTWQDAFHLACSARVDRPPSQRPGKHIRRNISQKIRLTDEGAETQKAVQCFKLARRIKEYEISRSAPLLRKILGTKIPLDDYVMTEAGVTSDPSEESRRLREATRSYMQAVVRRRIASWKQTLQNQAQNPTSALYRWLKNEGPAGPIVLTSEGKPYATMKEVFGAHRQYWEGVCAHPQPEKESEALSEAIQGYRVGEWEQITGTHILEAIRATNLNSVAGLDGWKPSTFRMMDRAGADALAHMYNHIIKTGCWPTQMTSARVSLLHKPGTEPEKVSSWRPITITSCFYRLFARVCLNLSIHRILPHLPAEMLGGLPGKTTPSALFRVFCWIERIIRTGEGRLYGVSLDASKCFDRISVLDALRAGAACNFPAPFLAAIGSFYQAYKRFTSIRQMLDESSWSISRGVIQGCSVSVILTCCVLKTWHDLSCPGVLSLSFIDDRLLLSDDSEALELNWTRSQAWDVEHQWQVNSAKTIQVSLGGRMNSLSWGGEPLTQDSKFTWLGHEYFLAYNLERTVWPKRLLKTQDAIRRLSQLSTTPVVKQKVVERAIAPIYSFGMHASLPPQLQIKGLTASLKAAVWGYGKKRFHAWPLACATLYRAHSLDVWSGLVYAHMSMMFRAFRTQESRDDYISLSEAPVRIRTRGPAQLFRNFLAQLHGHISDDWRVTFAQDCDQVPINETSKILHGLRSALKMRLLDIAIRKRQNMRVDGHTIDLSLSVKRYRRQESRHISGMVTLLCDGLITQSRMKHIVQGSEERCQFCGHAKEDAQHVYWECPHWAHLRSLTPAQHAAVQTLPAAARLCGYALSSFSEGMRKVWGAVQEQCSRIAEMHQKIGCKKPKMEVPASSVGFAAPAEIALPAAHQEWIHGRRLPLQYVSSLATQRNPWIYSRRQWNILLAWLASCRIHPDPTLTPPVSLLEMYVGYLLAVDQYRFHTGVSSQSRGHWWTVQIAHFARAIRTVQALALPREIVPSRDEGAERYEGDRHWGVMPQVRVTWPGFMLEGHAAIRRHLEEWVLLPTPEDPSASSGAELWRRRVLGRPESQTAPHPTLNGYALTWAWSPHVPRTRFANKQVAVPWMLSFWRNQAFAASLRRAAEELEIESCVAIAAVEGVTDIQMLSLCAGKRTKRTKLLAALRAHNSRSHLKDCHLAKDDGHRTSCAICGMSASQSHATHWFARTCGYSGGGRVGMVDQLNDKLSEQIRELEGEAMLLRMLAARLK